MNLVLTLALAILFVSAVLTMVEVVKGFIKKVAKAPGKGLAKLGNYFKNRKVIKANIKLDKAFMKADNAARLNAAKQNPNYANFPEVKKILAKREYKASKKLK